MHRDAAQEGHAEAHDAVLASLQCMQALTSGGGGMDAAIAAPDFVQCLCSVLDPDDQDCSKLVVEMLTKLCLYSADGYCAALQVSTLPWHKYLPPTPTQISTPLLHRCLLSPYTGAAASCNISFSMKLCDKSVFVHVFCRFWYFLLGDQ